MDLYRLTIQDSQDSMQFDLLDAPIKIEDVEGAVDNTVLTGDIFTDYLFLKKRWEQKWAIMCKDEYERLRGFYTRQWSLATVPSVKVTQGYLENASWEGQVFYINTPYGGEIDSMSRMTGDASQQTYSGKNLFNATSAYSSFNPAGTTTVSETNISAEANGFTLGISGTTSGTWSCFARWDSIQLKPSTKYTLSREFEVVSGTSYNMAGGIRISINGTYTTNTQDSSVTFTTDSTGKIDILFYIAHNSTDTGSVESKVKFSHIQLEEGESITEFEKYFGGYPAPNPQYPQAIRTVTGEQTISINGTDFKINLGKNLFDKDNASIISGYVNQSGIIVSSPGVRILYIQCKPNTTYTVQKTNSGTNQRFCVFDSVLEPDVNVSILHSVGTRAGLDTNESYTITTEPTARYLGVFFRVAATTPSETDILDTIQIEEGNTKTDYVSYITPVELCKTGLIYTYPDTIAKDNDGDWSIIREVGIINAKNASYTKVGNCFQSTSKFPTDRVADSATKMTNFTFNSATTNISTLLANGEFGFSTSGRLTLRIDSVQTAGDFATWLNSNDSVIYYHMSNPIETKITDATLISQLNAIQAALQEGQNTVAVTANGSNLPAKTITLNGIAGREKPVLAQTNVRIGLSDGGVLNACECRQNVTLSMRETA